MCPAFKVGGNKRKLENKKQVKYLEVMPLCEVYKNIKLST